MEYTIRMSHKLARPITKNGMYTLMLSAPFDRVKSAMEATFSVVAQGWLCRFGAPATGA
jgi:hypothetical protein